MSLTATIRRVLLLRLRNEEQPLRILPGLEEQVAQLETFVGSIGASADNSSLLVVGRPGSGRRSSISYALSRVVGHKVVLWLDGSSISDDVTALHEISRQLSIDPSGEGVDAIDDGDAEPRGVASVNDEASESEGDGWGDDTPRDEAATLARARRFISAQCPALINAARAAARSGGGALGGLPSAKLASSGPAERAASAVSTATSPVPAATAIPLTASADGGTSVAASLVSSVLDLAAALLPRPSRLYTSTALLAAVAGGGASAAAAAPAAAIAPARAATYALAVGAAGSKRRRRPLREDEGEGESCDIHAAAAAAAAPPPAPTSVASAAALASALAKRRRGSAAAGRSRAAVAGGGDGEGEEAGPPVLLHAPTTHRPVTGGKQVRPQQGEAVTWRMHTPFPPPPPPPSPAGPHARLAASPCIRNGGAAGGGARRRARLRRHRRL